MREMAGFLNTGSSLASDITLTIYLFLLVPGMLLGFYFARRKKYSPNHKLTMTSVVLLNWVLIVFVMVVGYRDGVLPYLDPRYAAQFAGDPRIALPTIHGILGGVAQLIATYLVIRMWFENILPSWLMVKRIKRYMRFTLALWLVTASLGAVIYFSWYINPLQVRAASPVVTIEPGATLEPGATAEPGATLELLGTVQALAGTAELQPGATSELSPLITPGPQSTSEIQPAITAEVTPGPAVTPELDSDDAERATRDASRATEDAADDALDATEDAAGDAADAARDSARATEDAAEDAAKATEDAAKDRGDD